MARGERGPGAVTRKPLALIMLALGAPLALQAQAQPSRRWGVGAGAGLTVPLGFYSSTDNPGVHALAYFSYSVRPAFSLGLDVGSAWTPHKASGHTHLDEILVDGVWHPGERRASPRPFLLASIGAVNVDTDNPSKGAFAWGGGGGVSVGHGDARVFFDARFVRIQASGGALSVIPITVGFATLAP